MYCTNPLCLWALGHYIFRRHFKGSSSLSVLLMLLLLRHHCLNNNLITSTTCCYFTCTHCVLQPLRWLAQHRYYGESQPFGPDSLLVDPSYLSVEQALADYVALIEHLKQTLPGAADSPVIAAGGSYGGMLSAWMRIKYPWAVTVRESYTLYIDKGLKQTKYYLSAFAVHARAP